MRPDDAAVRRFAQALAAQGLGPGSLALLLVRAPWLAGVMDAALMELGIVSLPLGACGDGVSLALEREMAPQAIIGLGRELVPFFKTASVHRLIQVHLLGEGEPSLSRVPGHILAAGPGSLVGCLGYTCPEAGRLHPAEGVSIEPRMDGCVAWDSVPRAGAPAEIFTLGFSLDAGSAPCVCGAQESFQIAARES